MQRRRARCFSSESQTAEPRGIGTPIPLNATVFVIVLTSLEDWTRMIECYTELRDATPR